MYGLSDQKSTPVCCGEFNTERGVSSTNFVPRRRSSRTGKATEGRNDGRTEKGSASWRRPRTNVPSFRPSVIPSPFLSAARPPALHAHETARLAREAGAAVGAAGGGRRGRW